MPDYHVQIARSARKKIEELPASVMRRVAIKIDQLATVPRPPGCIKLQGARDRWRLRVGDYRIIYSVIDARRLVDVAAVRHRREAYE